MTKITQFLKLHEKHDSDFHINFNETLQQYITIKSTDNTKTKNKKKINEERHQTCFVFCFFTAGPLPVLAYLQVILLIETHMSRFCPSLWW